MSEYYYLNEDKTVRPCHLLTWSTQFQKLSMLGKKHVGDDEIEGKRVSTVWLGLNHRFDEGKPLIFETMVFKDKSGAEIYCERYSTWEEAEEGHQKAIQWVKDGCKDY